MCIAIYKSSSAQISDDTLYECFKANGDGCGFAYINTDHQGFKKIIIKKDMTFEGFLRKYKRALRNAPTSPFLIHFRIRTHGVTSIYNCHPFSIDNEHVFIHNGIISGMNLDPRKSDTQMFNEEYLQQLPAGWMQNPAILNLIERSVSYNKLIFMNIEGEIEIINEEKGEWEEEGKVWYSNATYKKPQWGNRYNAYGYQDHKPYYPDQKKVVTIPPQTVTTTSTVLTLDSKTLCDGCKEEVVLREASCYWYMGGCTSYCKKCHAKWHGRTYSTKGQIITPSCYIDWFEEDPKDSGDILSKMSEASWKNPWGIVTEEDEANWQEYLESQDFADDIDLALNPNG